MQTKISDQYIKPAQGRKAEQIIRSCVHCGFCNATCPTYQLLGNELDGPRGRIYLIKQALEGQRNLDKMQIHLDRCLTCLACETTCPSGVQYGQLLEIGRDVTDQNLARTVLDRVKRYLIRKIMPYPQRFKPVLFLLQVFSNFLPNKIAKKIPTHKNHRLDIVSRTINTKHNRKMLLVPGCVQSVVTPETNLASLELFDQLNIDLIEVEGSVCCGAIDYHLSAKQDALLLIKQNIDTWWPYVENGIEAIVSTASGCGVLLKQYGEILKDDSLYAEKAAEISRLCKDFSEVICFEEALPTKLNPNKTRIAFHSPCSLQHGQKLSGLVEQFLIKCGFVLSTVPDPHLCCGSAGSYSLLQESISQKLLKNKLKALESDSPELIVTANIGCQLHLSTLSTKPVIHWAELLNQCLIKE